MDKKSYQSFVGTGWSFPPEFSRLSGTVGMTSDQQDIEASLRILLGTSAGERFLRPKYGLNLQSVLFDPMDLTNTTFLQDKIKTNILIYEPRIKIVSLDFDTSQLADGRLQVVLEYIIRSTNSRFNLVYPYFLNDGNEVDQLLDFDN